MKPRMITALLLGGLVVVGGVGSANAGSTASGNTVERRAVSCPDHYQRPQFTNYPALHRVMVPRKPTRMFVCRYAGLNAKDPKALEGSGVIPPGGQLHRVVRVYDALPKPPSGVVSCPADDGHEITVRFRYRHRPNAYVRQDMTGCRIGTNGHRTVTALNKRGNRLLRLLRKLSGA
jgi:hypothetical protein